MRRVDEGTVVYRAEDMATIEHLLVAALLILICVALYATFPLWRWEKRGR